MICHYYCKHHYCRHNYCRHHYCRHHTTVFINIVNIILQAFGCSLTFNRMKLNQDETQYIWIGSKFQLSRINFPHLVVIAVPAVDTKSLDQHLTMSEHVGNLCARYVDRCAINQPTYSFKRLSYLDWITVTLCFMVLQFGNRTGFKPSSNHPQCISTCPVKDL